MEPAYTETRLDKLVVFVKDRLSKELIYESKLQAELFIEETFKEMVCQVRAKIYRSDLDCFHYSHPEGIWQWIKHRWFPKWLLKKSPVKFVTIHIERYNVYPNISVDKSTYRIPVMKIETNWNGTDWR